MPTGHGLPLQLLERSQHNHKLLIVLQIPYRANSYIKMIPPTPRLTMHFNLKLAPKLAIHPRRPPPKFGTRSVIVMDSERGSVRFQITGSSERLQIVSDGTSLPVPSFSSIPRLILPAPNRISMRFNWRRCEIRSLSPGPITIYASEC